MGVRGLPRSHSCGQPGRVVSRCTYRHLMLRPTIADLDVESRPRERLVRLGRSALSDAELVALLLGSGTSGANAVDLARHLLTRHGGPAGVASLDVHSLAATGGIGPAKAARVVAAFELGRRRDTATDIRPKVSTSEDIARLIAPLLVDQPRERVVAVVCDRRSRVIATTVVAEGGTHGAAFPVREVLAEVLRRDGSTLALAHQHPGGDPTPSQSDFAATRAVTAAAEQCGVRFLDHVVIGGWRWRSIKAVIDGRVSQPPPPAG